MTDAPSRPQNSAARVPPHSLDAEESLLGAMLLADTAISAVSSVVQAEDFYKPSHRHVFEAIQTLYGAAQGVDPVTVAEELDRANLLEAVGGAATLVTLQARTPAITNAEYYARIVSEKALLRRLITVAGEVAELGYAPLDDVETTIDAAESKVYAVAKRRNADSLQPIGTLLEQGLERLEVLNERGEDVTGTPTGFTDLDQQLAGLQPGALIVIGARPAMGKTAFALGLAAHAAVREQRPVLFFSLEMSHLELTQRLIAAEARLEAAKLRTGRLTDPDWTKITRAMGRLGEGRLWIDDNPALTVTEIRSKARRLQDELDEPLGLIVIDYLQLMQGRNGAENRQVEVAEISRGLKVLARELSVPVVALSQLSRQLELRADKRPVLADLRESGCLVGSTRVLRADTNTEVTIGELATTGERNVPVWTLTDDWRLEPGTLTHAFPSGTKRTFSLRLASGREVVASANHPFRTVDRWCRLDELTPGARIATPRSLLPPDALPPEPSRTAAELAQHSVAAGVVDPVAHQLPTHRLAEVVAELFGRIGSVGLTELRGRPLVRITATSTSRRLLDDLQLLLLRFGLLARITEVSPGRRWRLWLHGVEQQRVFLSRVGVAGERGSQVAAALAALEDSTGNPNVDTIPAEVRDVVVTELARVGMTQRELAAALGEQYCGGYLLGSETRPRATSRQRLGRIADVIDSKPLMQLAASDVFWDEVVEIVDQGEQATFDATVMDTHNFVANGIVVHNSIEQDADVVMFLYRDEVYHPDTQEKDQAEVIVAKHRAGPTGVCRLVFLDYCTQFANMAKGSPTGAG
ncbi:MAG: replicative DNA helicase [Actinomycetes bacterium]